MDNNELALALREQDLDKVAVYLSRCGQATNHDLVSLGYPDIGWDPVEGERFLDFLRFCVWVNGTCIYLRHKYHKYLSTGRIIETVNLYCIKALY